MDEYQITELVKDRYRTGSIKEANNFLLNDTTIISKKSYEHSYLHNSFTSKQVIGYVYNGSTMLVSDLEFPILRWDFIPCAYLYKKGYIIKGPNRFGPAPLPSLKYIIYNITRSMKYKSITGYKFQDRLVIELVDLDVVANNLNLPKIVSSVLGPKLISKNNVIEDDERDDINKRMINQKLFGDYSWVDAWAIVYQYFDDNKRKLSKEVFEISQAYHQVFRPYRVVYNTKTWQPVLV